LPAGISISPDGEVITVDGIDVHRSVFRTFAFRADSRDLFYFTREGGRIRIEQVDPRLVLKPTETQ
jgi:hypothetical protein